MANILVVDDENGIRLTLKAFLEKDGHTVAIAEDAHVALEILGTSPVDVVVSDIILPRMTGIALLQKAREVAPGVEVIIMTGEPTVETASEAVRAGAFDYLFKPISREVVCRTVNNAARMRTLRQEREQLEESNDHYRVHLERLVAERTEALEAALVELRQHQQQLVQQERLRALGEMASGIAHDFNNALSVIMGFVELLKTNPDLATDSARLDRYLGLILTAAKDGSAVVNRLREFYRPREQNEGFTHVDLRVVGQAAIALTAPRWQAQAQARGINVEIVDDLQPVPPVNGNASELREVLTNLIINAVDALARDGTVTLACRQVGNRVAISVTDTGVGMTDDVRRRCLEPFFTTKEAHGTGLGLAVTYGIVTRHDGTVDIASEPGTGTCMTLSLPVAQTPAQAATNQPACPHVQPLRILIVDDLAEVRELLADLLTGEGHQIRTADSGEAALKGFRPGDFDLVITDRAMPGMAGDQLAWLLKETDPQLPIIMLTGFGSMMISAGERPDGVDAVLGKPLAINDLQQAIARLQIVPRAPA